MTSQLGMKVMKSEVIGTTCEEEHSELTTETLLVGFYFCFLFIRSSNICGILCCFKINKGSIFKFKILVELLFLFS